MATETFGDVTGDLNDRVKLILNESETVVYASSYEVSQSILTQPSTFSLRLGWGGTIKDLIARVQPGTKFQLEINGALQQTGAIDGYDATSDGTDGGSLTIHGRDALAPLHDAFIDTETSFGDATYAEMVAESLRELIPDSILYFNNDANRKLTTGIGVKTLAMPDVDPTQNATGPSAKQIKTRVGERVYEFVKRQLDRAGLFLWAAGDGSFVLAAPNANQAPRYQILRRRGQTRNAVNVVSAHHKNSTEGRYTEATIIGRGGGKKLGRTKTTGHFADPEMDGWFPNGRPLLLRDQNLSNNEQAEFYARRKLAETRRAGWNLNYTVAGHTIPSLANGARAVWGIDTVVSVTDDEFGLVGSYYIEKVVFRRNPKTTTEITLQRPADLIFAKGEAES